MHLIMGCPPAVSMIAVFFDEISKWNRQGGCNVLGEFHKPLPYPLSTLLHKYVVFEFATICDQQCNSLGVQIRWEFRIY